KRASGVQFSDLGAIRLGWRNASVRSLTRQVQEGFSATPRGGVEVGGLLVGPPPADGLIWIGQVIPLPIEYGYGPSFRPSGSDFSALSDAVSARRGAGQTVLGFYRSQTRGEVALRDSDRELLAFFESSHQSFASDFQVLLLVTAISQVEVLATGFSR